MIQNNNVQTQCTENKRPLSPHKTTEPAVILPEQSNHMFSVKGFQWNWKGSSFPQKLSASRGINSNSLLHSNTIVMLGSSTETHLSKMYLLAQKRSIFRSVKGFGGKFWRLSLPKMYTEGEMFTTSSIM